MPAALAVSKRQQIVESHRRGQSLPAIATELAIPFATVRKVWRRYRDEGESGLLPRYRTRSGPRRASSKSYRGALYLKRLHPGWGARLIRRCVQERWPDEPLPQARAIHSWFQKAGLVKKRVRRPATPYHPRGKQVHEVWGMDAKEHMQLVDGSYASWLLISDEASGAQLYGAVFPPASWLRDCAGRGAGMSATSMGDMGNA
jgi:transposase